MAQSGDVLDAAALGVQIEVRATGADTGGEYIEFDVLGRPCGLIAEPHVHTEQTESFEVIEGSMELTICGRKHVLSEGDTTEVPPNTPHTQRAGGTGPGRVRVRTTPAGTTEQFLERLTEMSATGQFIRGGWPRPVAAARFVMDFGDTGHAARPPVRVQRALARAILRTTSREYEFVDEWEVAAPPEAVFDALADARSYPAWWAPVYVDVDADGPAELGKVSRQHFKGRLPYHLHTESRIVKLDRPRVVAAEVEGDLRGYGEWTLTPTDRGTHVRFDWRVHADRRLLRLLTPLLRPAFRWNHNWAIARAMEGLEPYAQRTAAAKAPAASAA